MTAHPTTPLPSSTDQHGVDHEGADGEGTDPYGASDRRVLLDSSAARTCPVKTQNAFHPWLRRPEERLDPASRARRDAQAERRGLLLSTWLTRIPGAVDLRGTTAEPPGRRVARALEALEAGAPLVIGATLPPDQVGHRVGTPDALVRGTDREDGRPGYHPVVIKGHHVLTADPPAGSGPEQLNVLRFGTFDDPGPQSGRSLGGWRMKTRSRLADFLQLAHYARMLAAAGFDPPGKSWAGVIGTDAPGPRDTLPRDEPILGWIDLAEPVPGGGSKDQRSFLQYYDDEHWFRLAIAESAKQQSGQPDHDPPLLVGPIVNQECATCPWWQVCRPQLDPDDLGLRIERGRLRPRELLTLKDVGIGTVSALAAAELDPLVDDLRVRLGDRPGAESRLRTAARRARMLIDGEDFARQSSEPIQLPVAEVEIDFDLETAADGRIYLWGFWVTDGLATPYCRQFVRFDDLDEIAELALAREALSWLRLQVDGGVLCRVYHYSSFEVAKLRELAERSDDPVLRWGADYADHAFVDLLDVTKTHFFGVSGLGLKAIARHAGFRWRDPDPGGLNSQSWFADAVHGPPGQRPAARRRVLEYNEDDVIATNRLRGWLRAQ